MNQGLLLSAKTTILADKLNPLFLFLHDWLYTICADDYSINSVYEYSAWNITFESADDAIMVKLSDLPPDIGRYMKLS